MASSDYWIYCLLMAQASWRGTNSPASRLPQLLLSICCSLVAFTGAWLWWLGDDLTGRAVSTNSLTDPFVVQVWMHRLHSIGAYGIVALIVFMALRAGVRKQGWRFMFAVAFLVFVGVGVWSGFTADWTGVRMWSETVGTKMSVGLDLGDGPPLPDHLQRVRVHLSIVPAALLIVAFVSFDHYRRS